MKEFLIARSLKSAKSRSAGVFEDPDAVFPSPLVRVLALLVLSISLILNVVFLFANTELWIDNVDMRAGIELMRHDLEQKKPNPQGELP